MRTETLATAGMNPSLAKKAILNGLISCKIVLYHHVKKMVPETKFNRELTFKGGW